MSRGLIKEQPKTYCIRTYGCQMNELDSQIMRGVLERRGIVFLDDELTADLLIFNTCSIRDLAERKVLGKIGQLRALRKGGIIGVTGCMATAKKEGLLTKLPNVDFVLGASNLHQLDFVLDSVLAQNKPVVAVNDRFEEFPSEWIPKREDPLKAYVSIIRGCNNFCTYCVVPYTRGPEVSKAPEAVIEECKQLAAQGYKEVTLLGQNVNSYGKDQPQWGCSFAQLLARLDKEAGIPRLRFLTSHPEDISPELIQAVRTLPSVCEFVHFPLQAGADRILKKMNRGYTLAQYQEKIASLRQAGADIAVGTDMIVGFPTETEEEFTATCDAFVANRYSVAFLFAYSPRKGTPAFRWKDDISEEEKLRRLQILLKLHEDQLGNVLSGFLGKELEVLVERRNSKGGLKASTRCWKGVLFEGEDSLIGSFVRVKITGYSYHTLLGELI